MKRKKLSAKNQLAVAAYEAAAERIGSGEEFYACDSIWSVNESSDRSVSHSLFTNWFRPPIELGRFGWWTDSTFPMREQYQLPERTMRVLALLLMAELVRDGQIDFDEQ